MNDQMTELTNLAFNDDEIAILVDALEADFEDYDEAAKEANVEGDVAQSRDLAAAAHRVQAVLLKVRGAIKN
jgi:hypothetical protein